MLHDSARVVEKNSDDSDGGGEVVKRELKTKDDIKNYVKGLM